MVISIFQVLTASAIGFAGWGFSGFSGFTLNAHSLMILFLTGVLGRLLPILVRFMPKICWPYGYFDDRFFIPYLARWEPCCFLILMEYGADHNIAGIGNRISCCRSIVFTPGKAKLRSNNSG